MRTLICMLAVLGLLGATLPAHAAAGRKADARRDVYIRDHAADEGYTSGWNPDIRSVRVVHREERVKVVTRFYRLDQVDGEPPWTTFAVLMHTDADPDVDFRFQLSDSTHGIYRGTFGLERECGIVSKVDYDNNKVVLSTSRNCLERPRTVRVRAKFYSQWGESCCIQSARDRTAWTRNVQRG